jgi:SAM-dependent methyltransferase
MRFGIEVSNDELAVGIRPDHGGRGGMEDIFHVRDARSEEIAKRFFRGFVDIFQAHGARRILDLGCGQGFFLRFLKERGIECRGVEVDEELCRLAVENGLDVMQMDLMSYLRGSNDRFDGCFASHIVEHFAPVQVVDMFELLDRIVEPGGILVIVTPNIANLRRAVGDFWRDPTHVRPYPAQALKKLLEKSGWVVVRSGYRTHRPDSIRRTIVYGIRNFLIGRYWTPDSLYVVAQKPPGA